MPLHFFASLRADGLRAYVRPRVLLRTAVFLLLCLPLVWLLVAFENAQLNTLAERESERDLQNLARAFSEEVNSTVNTIDVSLIGLRRYWQLNRADFPSILQELNRELRGKVILQLGVTDAHGKLLFSTVPGARLGMDLSDREHIRVHLGAQGDHLFVGRPQIGRVSGTLAVQFTRPIIDQQGRLAGVIAASVAPTYFSRFYSSIELGPGASIALVRSDGTVIARSTRSKDSGTGMVLTGVPYGPGHAPAGRFRRVSQVDGVDRYYAWRDLPNYDLMVTVGQAVTDALARYTRQREMVTRTGIVVSLVLALLGWGAITASENRRRAVEQIRHMASHDGLTGLPNRALLADRLQQAILTAQREGSKLALIYFDLDKFKPVNDTHGHAIGDRLLQCVSARVRDGLRESDTLARVGGDEFVALLPRCADREDATKVASHILHLLNQAFMVEGLVLNISGSLGVAMYPDCGQTGEELLRWADQAMYNAKLHGRNQVSSKRGQVA